MLKRSTPFIAPVLAGLVLSLVLGPAAHAAPDDPAPDGPTYLVPEPLPDGVSAETPPSDPAASKGPAVEVMQGVLDLQVTYPELRLAGATWDERAGVVVLYSAAPDGVADKIVEQAGLSGRVVTASARYDATELRAMIRSIVGSTGIIAPGQRVVSAEPAVDGSSITIVLDESNGASRIPVDSITLPRVAVPVTVEYGPPATNLARNHAPGQSNVQRYSGAYMLGQGFSCTTGFGMVKTSTTTYTMASAHHCGGTIGAQWYYSTSTNPFFPIGSFQGQLAPNAGIFPDLGAWTGAGAGDLVPGMFIGNNTVTGSSVYAIRGAVSAPVNSFVCYSGSLSGTVCSNKVGGINVTVCFSGTCYDNLTRTEQLQGTPAAGQGDSGGPAYVSSNGIRAAGVISAGSNVSNNCTGDGGRLCSSIIYYAPLIDAFQAGYGLRVVQ